MRRMCNPLCSRAASATTAFCMRAGVVVAAHRATLASQEEDEVPGAMVQPVLAVSPSPNQSGVSPPAELPARLGSWLQQPAADAAPADAAGAARPTGDARPSSSGAGAGAAIATLAFRKQVKSACPLLMHAITNYSLLYQFAIGMHVLRCVRWVPPTKIWAHRFYMYRVLAGTPDWPLKIQAQGNARKPKGPAVQIFFSCCSCPQDAGRFL